MTYIFDLSMQIMLDLLFLFFVAAFILRKLLSVLGRVDENDLQKQKNGHTADPLQQQMKDVTNSVEIEEDHNVENTGVISPLEASVSQKVRQAVQEIRILDQNFKLDNFVNGVKKAFPLILKAVSEENQEVLRQLLSDDMYKHFAKHIQQLKQNQEKEERYIVAIRDVGVTDVAVNDNQIIISANIQSEQTYVLKDSNNNRIKGHDDKVITVLDRWSFIKSLAASDKIWKLCSI